MSLTVIIPFFDEYLFIEQALWSLGYEANDTLDFPVIIACDNPSSKARLFLDRFAGIPNLRIFQNETNRGVCINRNKAIRLVQTKYLAFLDADDFFVPGVLQDVLQFARESDADLVHLPTLIRTPDNGGLRPAPRDEALFARRRTDLAIDDFPEMRYAHAGWSLLIRTALLRENDIFYDEELRKFEDHLFILNCSQAASTIAAWPKYARVWRHRGESLSSHRAERSEFDMQLLSFEKTVRFMLKSYPADSMHAMRDMFFVFSRFLTSWPLLPANIAPLPASPEGSARLERLSRIAAYVPLDDRILNDPVVAGIFGTSVQSFNTTLMLGDVVVAHHLVCQGEWETVSAMLQLGSGPGLEPEMQTDLSSSPANIVDGYAATVAAPEAVDERLFSEFVLDEINGFESRSVSLACDAETAHKLVSSLQKRLDVSREQHFETTRTKEWQDACQLTNRFLHTADAVAPADVAYSWRRLEDRLFGDELTALFAERRQRAIEASLGDADFVGKRTIKSVIRSCVGRMLRHRSGNF